MYWELAKYVATLRTLKTDTNELLLKTKMEPAGHGGASVQSGRTVAKADHRRYPVTTPPFRAPPGFSRSPAPARPEWALCELCARLARPAARLAPQQPNHRRAVIPRHRHHLADQLTADRSFRRRIPVTRASQILPARLGTAYTTDVASRPIALLPLLLVVGACRTVEPAACDGFAERKLAISGAEYRGCAGEILTALDAIEPLLQAVVSDTADAGERDAARREYRKLRTLIRRTGMESDFWGTSATIMIKWPDAAVSAFNSAAHRAAVQYGAVLAYPNADNLGQGVRAHQDARRYYRDMR